jgi:hypothetical protein
MYYIFLFTHYKYYTLLCSFYMYYICLFSSYIENCYNSLLLHIICWSYIVIYYTLVFSSNIHYWFSIYTQYDVLLF